MLLYDERKSEKNMTAKYLRLSSEDGDKEESNSISNQRELIESYVSSHREINLAGEYVDDGYTGTNFDRPGFKRMIRDAQNGRINCIIVKDLSRLGRDYIGMGKYMERIFPMMGIRFIAINDNYDSAEQENPDDNTVVLFKNLLNDAYSRDISIKIRSHLDVKRRKGEFVGGFAPFGYKKAEKDRNCLVIDREAAEVVYNIFQWKLDGMSTQGIAERLNNNGIMSPYEYKRAKGMEFHTGFKISDHTKWGTVQVLRILTNETYVGVMVQGKRQKVNYKIKKLKDVEKCNWVRVENTHEPVISREVFDTVQEILKLDTRTSPQKNTVNLFSGLVYCESCGSNMVRRKVTRNGKQYIYLHCSAYHRGLGCTSHLISEKRLSETVYEILKKDMEVIAAIDSYAEQIKVIPQKNRKIHIDSDRIALINEEIKRYKGLLSRLNSDMGEGVVTKEEYMEFHRDFERRIEQSEKELKEIHKRQKKITDMNLSEMPWINYFKKYSKCININRRMLVELVENITVTDKDNINIRYRHDAEVKGVIQYCTYYGKPAKEI